MAILEDENHALRRRVGALEEALRHMQEVHAHVMSENTRLQESVNALRILLQSEGVLDERNFARVATSIRIDSLNGQGNAAMGLAKDMSLGGALIETDLPLSPGEIITVVFELEAQPYKIPAEVIRVTQHGYGIKFILGPQQCKALEVSILRPV